MYHIGDLKRYVRCPRYYFFSNEKNSPSIKYLRSDESTIELLVKHLHLEDYFRGVAGDMNERFFSEKDGHEWFVKTRFELNDLRIRIPVMHKDKDAYDLYFAYHGVNIKDLDLYYYRCNLEILRKLGITVDDVYIAYINKDYVFENELDYDELFIITDHYKGKRLIDLFDEEIVDYKETIGRIEATNLDSYEARKIRACHGREICPYYHECFPYEEELPDDSILTLVSSQYKEKMYQEGIVHLKDADIGRIEGNRVQYAQIMASRKGGLYVDRYNLRSFLKNLDKKPVSFIDFEWDTYLVPKYDGMRPLDVLTFEYALYILDENGELENHSFIGSGDCRREFVEALIEHLPEEGPIVAYNALGAECRRLSELAEQFPEYRKQLDQINDRFVDLAVPFVEGLVYDIRMRGNFTLKKLVDIVSSYNYGDLAISDGIKAVRKWRDIDKGNDEIDEEEAISELIEYCSLDAYGLYLVYKWLLELI